MKVREGLVFKTDGSLDGYVDIGDINNSFASLKAKINGDTCEEEFADHILTLMVRGIFVTFVFPLQAFQPEVYIMMSYNKLYIILFLYSIERIRIT